MWRDDVRSALKMTMVNSITRYDTIRTHFDLVKIAFEECFDHSEIRFLIGILEGVFRRNRSSTRVVRTEILFSTFLSFREHRMRLGEEIDDREEGSSDKDKRMKREVRKKNKNNGRILRFDNTPIDFIVLMIQLIMYEPIINPISLKFNKDYVARNYISRLSDSRQVYNSMCFSMLCIFKRHSDYNRPNTSVFYVQQLYLTLIHHVVPYTEQL
ncbi:hypothetical protein APICC_01522 [Apis cerana cerana]|uniref:Uncharacterized protein n=1 Tax=Apis cerana cerana TaxID=94128 RepID=A0A2A3E2I7_APICC|nr:hypothetical protein APICC_01522 [Apis cerana cerana]